MTRASNPRMAAMVSPALQSQVSRHLHACVEELVFLHDAEEVVRRGCEYDVLLLPASLLHEHWQLPWQELAEGKRRCAVLVYAPQADFRLWAEALELGCYDVVMEPFEEGPLREAVHEAFASTQQG